MSTILPLWAHVIFAILEPISLIAGWWASWFTTQEFVAQQVPNSVTPTILPSTQIIAYQLGNIYLLMMFVGVGVLYSTSEPKVVRNYLIALAIGDIGHLYMSYLGLGWDALIDVSQWNSMAWGNICATSLLFFSRVVYLSGLFGTAKRLRKSDAKVE